MKLRNVLKAVVFLALLLEINDVSAQKIAENEIKINVAEVSNSLNVIQQLDPKTFYYDSNKLKLPSGKQYGFIVEDFALQFPELVKERNFSIPAGKNAFKTVSVNDIDTHRLIPVLVGAIKEQQIQIENLQRELNAIKSKK
ncbi:MAG TPA: tail fiber domain-containing protein [Sphingobacteriaceae bacterium]